MRIEAQEPMPKSNTGFKPIFIIGCCNSGTTLLWQELLDHPEVSGPSVEGQDLPDIPRYLSHHLGKATFRLFAHPKFNNAYRLTEQDANIDRSLETKAVYEQYTQPGTRLIEKSPANSIRMRFLQGLFPSVQFVIIVRNGIAVAEGIRRKRWNDPERPQKCGQETDILEAAEQWLYSNQFILEDLPFLSSYKMIRYEDLIVEPQKTMNDICSFLNLDIIKIDSGKYRKDDNNIQIARLTKMEYDSIIGVQRELLTKFSYI